MRLYRTTLIGSFAIILFLSLATYFGSAAEEAMSKDGVGDLEKWRALNLWSGLSFYSATATWLTLIVIGLRRKGSEREQLFSVCGLSLLCYVFALIMWALLA